MASSFPYQRQTRASQPRSGDAFAEQLQLSRVHSRLVPMQRTGAGYSIDPAAANWFELPASRGFAGYGLGRALGLLLDAMHGLSALNETVTSNGVPFAHGEFAPLQFRVDPLGACRLVPLTTRHSISEDVAPPRAALGFLSPERLSGAKVGVRADVFSAGVLLWEALAGRRLAEEQSAEAIAQRLLGPKVIVPPLPPQLAWATPLKVEVERALSVDQEQRFADCAEFAAVILRLAQDHVASHAEIAAFFAANLELGAGSSRSSTPVSQQRLIASQGATLALPLVASSADPVSNSGEAGPRRHATLKMNVTLRMSKIELPIAIDTAPAPAPGALTPTSWRAQLSRERQPTPLSFSSTPLPSIVMHSLAHQPRAAEAVPPSGLPLAESPDAIELMPDLSQVAILPEIEPVAAPRTAPWLYRQRWGAAAAAALIGALLGFGLVALRGSRSGAAPVGTPLTRGAMAKPGAFASHSTPTPIARPDTSVAAGGSAGLIPNLERSALPSTPAARGRPLPSAPAQRKKDYGI